MSAFKRFLKRQAMAFEPELRKQAAECIKPEGKFIRPMLVFSAAAKGADKQKLIRRAAIAELIHLSTLIHDDVIDNASIRRGNPTVHSKYGARFAILLGDAIFAHTMNLSFEENDNELSRKSAVCVRDICEGEIRQTLADRSVNVSKKKYFEIVRGKTAVLFELACYMGAAAAGAGFEAWIAAAQKVGKELGIAYQIYDDICDWTKSEEEVGKTLGTDLLSGKQTFPLILLLEKLPAAKAKKLEKEISTACANPQAILDEMRARDIIALCKAEYIARIENAENILKKFGDQGDRLLNFCAAMRSLFEDA